MAVFENLSMNVNWILIWKFFKLGFWLIIGGVLTNFFLKYRYLVIIRQQRGTGQKVKLTFGRRVDKDNVSHLKLLGRKDKLPMPSNNYIYPAFMFLEYVELFQDAGNNINPIEFGFINDNPLLYPEEWDHKVWHLISSRETVRKYANDFWTKYAPFLSVALCGVVLLIAIVISYKQVDKVSEMVSSLGHQALQLSSSINAPSINP